MNIAPQQKLSSKEKFTVTEADKKAGFTVSQFIRSNTDYLINQSLAADADYTEMVSLYNAAAGILDEKAYKYVLNPYNTESSEYLNYPAKIRDYSIIKPIVKLFVGENDKRPNGYEVIALNSDAMNKYTETLNERVYDTLQQQFVNELNSMGVDTGVKSQPTPTIQDVIQHHKANYSDTRAITGQEALDYIVYNCDLDDKYQDAFYDWIVTGRVYSYKEVYRNDIKTEIVSPLEMWSSRDSHSNFIEDDSAHVRKYRLSPNSVIDRFRSELSEENINFLDSLRNSTTSTINVSPSVTIVDSANLDGVTSGVQSTLLNNGLVDVYHTVWKTFKKIGVLTYQDVAGGLQVMEVDDTYVLNKEQGDVKIEWEYISEFLQSWRVGANIYFGGTPLEVQRDEINNSSICKSCYNGRVNDDRLGNICSIVKQGLPYNILYNIYHYRFERTLAKNKDQIMLLPIGMIPKKWKMDKFMYEVDATGIAWFDETKPNAVNVLNTIRTMNMALASYAKDMIYFLNSIKNEYWESLGVTPQRYGEIMASEGKANTEQAIFRSAIVSNEEFRKFDKFKEKDYNGLLDYSKVAWINGKKGMYINSEGRKAFLSIEGDTHMNTEYGAFCKNNSLEADKLKGIKQLALTQVQKTGKLGTSAEVLDSNNFSKVKDIIKRGEEIEQFLIEKAAKQEQESNERIAKMTNEATATKAASDKYKVDKDYQKGIDVALINAHVATMSLELDSSGTDEASKYNDQVRNEQAASMNRLKEMDIQHKNLKIQSDNFNQSEDRKIQEKEIKSREKVAGMKKKT